MIRVRCQQHVTIDEKGRLALPAPIRRALSEMNVGSLVLTFSQGAVWAWTPSHYESEVEAPMYSQDPFAEHVQTFVHAMMSTANDAEIDGQGRVRIPPQLREYAGIDKEVVVHVLMGHVEIWDKAAWEQRFQESLAKARSLPGMPGRGPRSAP